MITLNWDEFNKLTKDLARKMVDLDNAIVDRPIDGRDWAGLWAAILTSFNSVDPGQLATELAEARKKRKFEVIQRVMVCRTFKVEAESRDAAIAFVQSELNEHDADVTTEDAVDNEEWEAAPI